MAIEIIYFDLGNVLVSFCHDQGIRQVASVAGCSTNQVQTALITSGLNNQYESGEVDTEEFCHRFCTATDTNVGPQELALAWSSIFTLRPQAMGMVARIAATGMRLGILSNTSPAHWEFVSQRYRLLQTLFCPIITSFEAGAMKPDAHIYAVAEEAAGVHADGIYFTDDRAENVAAARAAGWQAELFTDVLQLAETLEERGVTFNR